MPPLNLHTFKRGLVTFWAVWYSLVVASNVADLLKAWGVLPADFAWVSNNLAILMGGTGAEGAMKIGVTVLFLGGLAWEAACAGLFWKALSGFKGGGWPRARWRAAFTASTALWCVFLMMSEAVVQHGGVPLYLAILSTHVVTFLAVELMPDEA